MKKTLRSAKTREATQPNAAVEPKPPLKLREPFPIAGLGASAGGLDALEQFLRSMPMESGVAFVVVQHLDPTHKGILPEILQRATQMPVQQVKDRMKVEPNCVYVIPPNKDMSILNGVLHLLEPAAPRGLRLPIDFFLRSLAEDRKDRSIAIIVSGMGTDGTLGLRAIKERGGLVLVQDPATAKFDGMPRSAVDTRLADMVAPADKLAEKLVSFLAHAPELANRLAPVLEGRTQSALEKAIILLRLQTGTDFSAYKRSTIYRRIERRMGIHQIDKIAVYVRYLQESPEELDKLYRELLIGVTSFFRDPATWAQLKREAIPGLLATRQEGGTFRAWVAGCSTGEEAYSLAIVFKEALEAVQPKAKFLLQVFATDLDKTAIEKARHGTFPDNIAADVSPERLARFFIKEPTGGYRVGKEIRDTVIFAPQNLIGDTPFTKLDLVTCRNLLIYLLPETQAKLIPLFHYSLRPGGMLLLGSAESTGRFNDLFEPLDRKSRIFRKKATMTAPDRTELPVTFQPIPTGLTAFPDAGQNASSLKTVADEFILQRFSPAAVLVSEDGDILYVSGRTGNFLEPASGRANWNIFAMAREGLRLELAGAFPKVVRQRRIALLKDLRIGMNGGKQLVDVTLQPLESPPPVRGMVLIVFSNVRAHVAPPARAKSLRPDYKGREFEQEMLRVQEDLATAREEMQTSQEELKSANEELQSTNEELQSTNEELTTSKEEMQSLNEELQLVNAELQSKIDELLGANEDLKNLLDSTDIATVFLNGDLLVRRFTTQATSIFRLIPSDVGRPITDIASSLNYKDLAADVKQVLSSFVFLEKEVAAWDDRGFRVRIMPQSSGQGQIEGVVITFMDITAAKALEAEIRERDLKLRTVFEAISEGIVFQDQERRVTFVNSAAERIFGQTFEQIEQQPPADPRWQAIYEDGSPVPEEAHPSVVAFRTGMQEKGRLGILDPTSGSRVWVNVTATPVCPAGEVRPKQVFTVFERIAECTEKLARKQVEGHEEEGRAIGRVKAASRKTTA